MARTLSATVLAALYGAETDEVFITLLDINYDGQHIYLCNDSQDITHNSQVYTSFPFAITPPDDTDGTIPTATLEIDNIDQTVMAAIATAEEELTVTCTPILADDPDTALFPATTYQLRDFSANRDTITGTLSCIYASDEPFPGLNFNPSDDPMLYSAPPL